MGPPSGRGSDFQQPDDLWESPNYDDAHFLHDWKLWSRLNFMQVLLLTVLVITVTSSGFECDV